VEQPRPSAPTPTPIGSDVSPFKTNPSLIADLEQRIHLLVNVERGAQGQLMWDRQLANIARAHSVDQATYGYFSHEDQSGRGPTERASQAGYECVTANWIGVAENIFQTFLYSSYTYRGGRRVDQEYLTLDEMATQIVDGWMDSPGHRRNILDPYTNEGIGVGINDADTVYVTQNFC